MVARRFADQEPHFRMSGLKINSNSVRAQPLRGHRWANGSDGGFIERAD